MTYAEALVYSATFAQHGSIRDAYEHVWALRNGSLPSLPSHLEWEAILQMAAEFKAFDPRGAPDGR